jgi:hypothetical protein
MNGPVTEPLLAVAVNPVRPLLSHHLCGSTAKINSGGSRADRRLGRRQTWAVSGRMLVRCVTGAARKWSVDVEDGLAADAAVQQVVERWGGFAPGAFELNLAVEAAVGDERA